ncbi:MULTISPECIES: neutral zinc metallopeptidase [unclassified Microbacterium]|uniref:KPN_02809 family neutral zinc metallopeptidase n=1 Tax=unclassified Microbacterium TaxID=2609290 RepID=UPI00214A8BA0|nr:MULTISPECIES: neutral zinc metallopeptidase [unclassified Microbacterium]MCR2784701.1 neutral zinc metallopeptidase [Microbacterium sp. zg.B96]MDL5352845.1 neutral zinc metallopeptidase [Microbacterium sp. zg-YB36]WIM16241.1 neutral zinc metallopeptidase [Microbacterium sp. zg-B96]
MTFNDNARVGGNTAKRRGRGGAIVGGGIAGIGGIAVLLLSIFTGQDFTSLLGGAGAGGAAEESAIENCDSGADANARDDCRLAAASLNLDQFWAAELDGYRQPQLIVVDGSTPTACGTASNATGPFYCPSEETVYVDPTFFGILREQFGTTAGPLAQLYVLAHEYGHHVQQITGIFDRYPPGDSGPDSNGVRIELQADCLAGAWVADLPRQVDENGVPFMQAPTETEIRDALGAAAAVGDDNIQRQSGGTVNPESWTHGSSEQRQRWFDTGYQHGAQSCDTFSASGSEL